MKFYWSHKSLPEFANVLPEHRKRIWKLCLAKANRHPIIWAFWAAQWVVLASLPFWLPVVRGLIEHLIDNHILVGGLITLVVSGPWFLAFWHLHMSFARRHIAAELPGHCSRCGYDLTGIASRQCPECGALL